MRPSELDAAAVDAWLAAHPGWERATARDRAALARTFTFADFGEALAFVVKVGLAAERRDHHPDVELGWGRARVVWTTHDAGGVTSLDLELASRCDTLAGGAATT